MELSKGQYDLIFNSFSLTIAIMGASFLFFLLSRARVSPKYRPALLLSAIVVGVAAYHYVRILSSWTHAFTFQGGRYVETAIGFNEAYRYADWIVTVPLLLAELVAILGLTNQGERRRLLWLLSGSAVLMVALGYPGEVSGDTGTKVLFGVLSTIPFLIILTVLFFRLRASLDTQPASTRRWFDGLRWILLATWGVYPIVYLFPLLGFDGATSEVLRQVGYTVADILAKPGYGLVIYMIARLKTAEDGYVETPNDGVSVRSSAAIG